MASKSDLHDAAMALEGTSHVPHHKRMAYKVKRIYATVDAAGQTLNIGLSVDEQTMKAEMAPHIFAPIPGTSGASGWTQVDLDAIARDELEQILHMAWQRAG